jgi:outer membrane murein-binding lipoprotein Lpp
MKRLKEMGYSNNEISKLTRNLWSEATVKAYTKGIRTVVGTNEGDYVASKEATSKLLAEMISSDYKLDDIRQYLEFRRHLKEKDIDFSEILEVVETAKDANLDLRDLIDNCLSVINSGISLDKLPGLLQYKNSLDQNGFTADSLPELSRAAVKYGTPAKLVEAANMHLGLGALKAELSNAENNRNSLQQEIDSLDTQVRDLTDKKAQLESALRTYEELRKNGFDQSSIHKFSQISEKYGGVKATLQALEQFANLDELSKKANEAQKKVQDLNSEIKKLEADHAFQKHLIIMCDALYKKGFNTLSIERIYSVAQKYGEPLDVLKTIDSYGESKEIEEQIKSLLIQRNQLQS